MSQVNPSRWGADWVPVTCNGRKGVAFEKESQSPQKSNFILSYVKWLKSHFCHRRMWRAEGLHYGTELSIIISSDLLSLVVQKFPERLMTKRHSWATYLCFPLISGLSDSLTKEILQNTNFSRWGVGDVDKVVHLIGEKANYGRKRTEIYLVHLLLKYPWQRFKKWGHFLTH